MIANCQRRSTASIAKSLLFRSRRISTNVTYLPETLMPAEAAMERFEDIDNIAWKSPHVQSWVHSAKTLDPMGLMLLDRDVFGCASVRKDLIFRAMEYERSWREQGTESSKNMGQVRGSTRKPAPQKGRGKARIGSLRAPQFRGGYAVHGNRPHSKSTDIPSKLYNAAMCHSLSAKFLQSQLVILDEISSKTLSIRNLLTKHLGTTNMALPTKMYLMFGDPEVDTELVGLCDEFNDKHNAQYDEKKRRIPRKNPILLSSARDISVCPLMEREFVVLDKRAVEFLEAKYGNKE